MTDFVDVLEQQLRAAHGRRERFVPPWRTGMVLAAAAGAAAIVIALIIGLASPGSEQGARPPAGPTTPPTRAAPCRRSSTSRVAGGTRSPSPTASASAPTTSIR